MFNNFEIADFMAENNVHKGYEVAQVDSKVMPEATHLLYREGYDKFYFVRILDNKDDPKSKKKITAIEDMLTYKFSQFDAVQYDQFAMSKKYVFSSSKTGEELTLKTWIAKKELRVILPSHIKITTVDRKWYNKLVGFRSNDPVKMFGAMIFYAAIIAIIVKFVFFR